MIDDPNARQVFKRLNAEAKLHGFNQISQRHDYCLSILQYVAEGKMSLEEAMEGESAHLRTINLLINVSSLELNDSNQQLQEDNHPGFQPRVLTGRSGDGSEDEHTD